VTPLILTIMKRKLWESVPQKNVPKSSMTFKTLDVPTKQGPPNCFIKYGNVLGNGINWFNPGKLEKNEHIACDLNLEWWQLKTCKPALGSFRKWKLFTEKL
jgi:hypothetical protein